MIRNLGGIGVACVLIGALTLLVAVLTVDFQRGIAGALFIVIAGYEYRLRELKTKTLAEAMGRKAS